VPGTSGAWHLLFADTVAILVFATVGQLSHHRHLSATGYARDALPLLAGWCAAFALFRGRFVPTWLVGVSAGVLLRAAILSHWYAKELAFWGVALAFVGALVLVARKLVGSWCQAPSVPGTCS
jgi:Protein of unknown function (DUF3054)